MPSRGTSLGEVHGVGHRTRRKGWIRRDPARADAPRLTDECPGETCRDMELERTVGLRPDGAVWLPERRARRQLDPAQARGHGRADSGRDAGDEDVLHLAGDLFARYREQTRLLSEHLCPADQRIQQYIDGLLAAAACRPGAPAAETLILDRYGLARELSLPIDADAWHNELVSSYRLDNGVLHNPVSDRRTTQGVFHVAEGGLPIPADKIAVPLAAYARCSSRRCARRPSCCACRSRRTGRSPSRPWSRCCCGRWSARRCPRSRRRSGWRSGSSCRAAWSRNLDFVESIFGNAGDPYLPENDAGARRRPLDRPHRLRHPRPAPHAATQEGRSACRT